jgi:hypothetical protein
MNRTAGLVLGVLAILGGLSLSVAQNYKCDWSVVGIGGGEMAGSAYRCGATAGQTAAGFVTASNYWALIGYWLPEGQVGVREQARWPNQGPLVTRLYAAQPNPFHGGVVIRYSLAAPGRATLRIYDQAGRVMRQFAGLGVKCGVYSVTWDGADVRGRLLANGVYFSRLTAGGYTGTEKLVLQR